MANIKRDLQVKLMKEGIVKGFYVGLHPKNAYFQRLGEEYFMIPERNTLEIFKRFGWEVPESLLAKNRNDKGGRPKIR